MPEPTISARNLMQFEYGINRSTMLYLVIELCSCQIIKCPHVSSIGRLIIQVECFVDLI
jgi:hypothetical protein